MPHGTGGLTRSERKPYLPFIAQDTVASLRTVHLITSMHSVRPHKDIIKQDPVNELRYSRTELAAYAVENETSIDSSCIFS